MKNIFSKIISFLSLYKWLILLCVPIIFFIWFVIYLFSTPQTTTPPDNSSLTITPFDKSQLPTLQPTQIEEATENELDPEMEQREDFQKRETRSDGSNVYTFKSENSERPNILITTNDNTFIFSRTLNSQDLPMVNLSTIKADLGNPDKIIQGSKFYGKQAAIYIYSSYGITLIGDPQTDKIFEEQHFPPMSIDAYLQRFGDQN